MIDKVKEKCKRFRSYFCYNENGRPPYGWYVLLLLISIVVSILSVSCNSEKISKDFFMGLSVSFTASLVTALILDYARFRGNEIFKAEKMNKLLKRLNYSARYLISNLSMTPQNENLNISCYDFLENYAFGKYDDYSFKKMRDIVITFFAFILEAQVLIDIERGLIDYKQLDQLMQTKISVAEHLSQYEGLKNQAIENEDNILRHKRFISNLCSFFMENLPLFKGDGLLNDIGSKTIKQVKDSISII
ncbi:hypothetical protein IKZ40_00180 [bacterium]|nr:hypothetical protein [bacterium]